MLRLLITTFFLAAVLAPAAATKSEAPPAIRIAGATVEATSSSGATASFDVLAFDPTSGNPISVTCSPTGGGSGAFTVTAPFPLGSTSVSCDGVLENGDPAHGKGTVTVQDTTPPSLTQPANVTTSTTDSSGVTVGWDPVTGTDIVDGSVTATCAPASGTKFPVGVSTVICTATDTHGNTAQVSFTVTVSFDDTHAPTFTSVPGPITVTTSGTGAVVTYSVTATDDSGNPPVVICTPNSGSTFPVGTTTVQCSASDGTNTASASFDVTVIFVATAPPPPPPSPPPGTTTTPSPPTPPVAVPPNVQALKAESGDGRVRLTWQTPAGVDHVIVTRSLTSGAEAQVVYTGPAEVFTDLGVVNDVEYQYLVVSVNAKGNRSAGTAVVAQPKRSLLKSPKDGARLRKAPKLTWLKNSEANYYNVQLFRGTAKILSIWPVQPKVALKAKWKYRGRTYKLVPGVYRWYVWPGFGPRSAVVYGDMLGFRTFQIVR
jgi:hypothetical protein